MSERILVRPAPGCLVRDPATGEKVPEQGRAVPRTSYWLRRILHGDLEVVVKHAPAPVALVYGGEE